MADLTVRDVPDDMHRALMLRAAQHGRSTEAEIREMLASAGKSEELVLLGNAFTDLGRKIGLTNDDFSVLNKARDKTPAEPMKFE
jgi:plasmid stability protein